MGNCFENLLVAAYEREAGNLLVSHIDNLEILWVVLNIGWGVIGAQRF
jgi:hypothetical protein